MSDVEQDIADVIMNRAIYQDREGQGMTGFDRESEDYIYCQNAAQSILGLLSAARAAALQEAAAVGWDAAVAAMTYEDGTPVEVAMNSNPYRTANG